MKTPLSELNDSEKQLSLDTSNLTSCIHIFKTENILQNKYFLLYNICVIVVMVKLDCCYFCQDICTAFLYMWCMAQCKGQMFLIFLLSIPHRVTMNVKEKIFEIDK